MDLIETLKNLVYLRKRPLLILNLEEINGPSVLAIRDILREKKFEELDVILQTDGGDINAAYNITKLFRYHASKVNILVPLFAKSAGTLICLGADTIVLTEISELGPLDAQIRTFEEGHSQSYKSALNNFKALQQVQIHSLETLDVVMKMIVARSGLKMSDAMHLGIEFAAATTKPLYSQLNPKGIGECDQALKVGQKYGTLVLTRYRKWEENKAQEVIKKLVYDYPSHGFIIDKEELVNLGLPAAYVDIKEQKLLDDISMLLLQKETSLIHLEEPKVTIEKTKSEILDKTTEESLIVNKIE